VDSAASRPEYLSKSSRCSTDQLCVPSLRRGYRHAESVLAATPTQKVDRSEDLRARQLVCVQHG